MARFRFVDRPAAEPEWKAVHRAADRGIADVRGPFLAEVEKLRSQISVSRTAVLIQEGGASAVLNDIEWFTFEGGLTNAFLPAFRDTQHRAMRGVLGVLEEETPAQVSLVVAKQDVTAPFEHFISGSVPSAQ